MREGTWERVGAPSLVSSLFFALRFLPYSNFLLFPYSIIKGVGVLFTFLLLNSFFTFSLLPPPPFRTFFFFISFHPECGRQCMYVCLFPSSLYCLPLFPPFRLFVSLFSSLFLSFPIPVLFYFLPLFLSWMRETRGWGR